MEKKVVKKLLVLLTLITILATDFFVLGSNLITYATQINSETNNSNIEFSAYFKKGETRVDSIEKSIKSEDLKLYAEIKVKNEGYLNGIIEIQNSNFNLKNESKSSAVSKIVGNTIHLNQINAGEVVEIELGIEPIISDQMTTDMLTKTSKVKLIGTYMEESYKGLSIESEKEVNISYKVDEKAEAELKTEIITNKVLSINGENKRIVQLLVKSRLTENEYPVEQTKLSINVPELSEKQPEEIEVIGIGELATNGEEEISKENWSNENGKVEIILKNETNENNEISWRKNVYDELVVTFIYAEDVNASNVEIKTDAEIKVYNSENTYKTTHTEGINEELDNVIMKRAEMVTPEIYKGQLYANINAQEKQDIEYNTETTLIVTNANVVEGVEVNESADVFGTEEGEIEANTKYITTEINKEKMLKIFGEDGKIEIKNGNTTIVINKDSEVNENGNIVIKYDNSSTEIRITTSKPVNAGVLKIKHTKVIIEDRYKRAQLQKVRTLKNATGASLELKETITKAELTVNKSNLSTVTKNENVKLGIKLITDELKYDLYKNPTIKIQLPKAVESVELNEAPSKLYADEFEINAKYNVENRIIEIKLTGEQTKYPETSATQLYLQLNLNMTLSRTAPTQTDKIIMTYVNENASQYDGGTTDIGTVERTVGISAPSGVIKMFNLSSNENTSFTENIIQQITSEDVGKTLNFETLVVNNTGADINNVRILGKLPTTGNTVKEEDKENTLETKLRNIEAPNATIYYTENVEATADVEDIANGWTTNLSELENAKKYLIKLDTLGNLNNYTAMVNVQVPDKLTRNEQSYAEYKVIYDTDIATNIEEESRKVLLKSSIVEGLELQFAAQVGQDELKTGDTVRAGEVIKYTVTAKYNGKIPLQNVQLKLDIPDGTVLVKPIEKYTFSEGTEYEWTLEEGAYVYLPDTYYEEITDSEKIAELTNIIIPELTTTYTIEYEVRVKTDITAGAEISSIATVLYNGLTIESNEIKNLLAGSNARVTIKRADDVKMQLYSGQVANYTIYLANLADEELTNLQLQINSDDISISKVETWIEGVKGEVTKLTGESIEEIKIDKIPAKHIFTISIYGTINEDTKRLEISANAIDTSGIKYRSNAITEEIPYSNAEITMSSPQENKEITQGDEVVYNVIIKNTGDINGTFKIIDKIPEELTIQKIYRNGALINQIDSTDEDVMINNLVISYAELKPGEICELDIITKVVYLPEESECKVISNKAEVDFYSIKKDESKEIKHTIIPTPIPEEDLKNIISGVVWIDKNENGQKDNDEKILKDVTVKLYETLSYRNYLKDLQSGEIIKAVTNETGKYEFSKMAQGSYIIIFEYDENKYEPATKSRIYSQELLIDGTMQTVVGTEQINIQDNMIDINVGLKQKTGNSAGTEEPETPETPETPDTPNEPDTPTETIEKKSISGEAWLDKDRDGEKDGGESNLSDIKVKLYSVSTKDYQKDDNGNILETMTNDEGKYEFNNIEKGSYLVLFEYDTEKYEPTIYLASGVNTSNASKAIAKNITINGEEETYAVTDTVNVQEDVKDINIGLKEKLIFDLELNKYISKIVVQNNKQTKTYDYEDKSFAKVEIHRKQAKGTLVVLEYTIKIKNTGEITGFAKNIVDYLPEGLTFSSELNKDWYILGDNLHTKGLENVEIGPGEEKEVKLILTKTMTDENTGLINNRAEIYQDYNKYGEEDIDSTPNNQAQDEDDFSSVDVIIGIKTGGSTIANIILLLINLVLIGIVIRLMIKNKIIKITTKKERR